MCGRLHKDPTYGGSWERQGARRKGPPAHFGEEVVRFVFCSGVGGNPPAGRARDEVPSFATSPPLPTARRPGAPVNFAQLYYGS